MADGGGVARRQGLHLKRDLRPDAVVVVSQRVPKLDALSDGLAEPLRAILAGQRNQRPAMQRGQGFLGNGQFDQRDSVAGATLKDLPELFDIGFRLRQPWQDQTVHGFAFRFGSFWSCGRSTIEYGIRPGYRAGRAGAACSSAT